MAIDVAVDPVGGDQFESIFRSLGKGGRHLVVGFTSGKIPALPVNLALLKSLSLVGVEIRHFLSSELEVAKVVRGELFDAVVRGDLLRPAVSRFALEHARDAVAALTDRGKVGKVVVTMG
ncbi:zinc-binding dehydrogenase [Paraburkholderia sp. 32]|uniref:zinc-binding dehydrogenase n=1 Tax=Paraburkholderia sp. 32 TaxID=2991057 RepID=UPI003D21A436